MSTSRRRGRFDRSARRCAVAQGLATVGEERLPRVRPVDTRRLLRDDGRREGSHRVGPGGKDADCESRSAAVVLSHVEVAVAVEFDDAGEALREVGRELVVVDGLGGREVERVPAGFPQALGEVALVVVDEEVGIHVADLGGRLAADHQRARLRPVDPPHLAALALHGQPAMEEKRAGQRRAHSREAPGAGHGLAVRVEQLRSGGGGFRFPLHHREQRLDRPRPQLGILVQQQAVAPARLAHQGRVVLRLAGPPLERDQADVVAERLHRLGRAILGGVVEDEDLALDCFWMSAFDRGQTGEQVLAAVRVHDAVGEQRWQGGHDNPPRGN
jgi:hypothetical protein